MDNSCLFCTLSGSVPIRKSCLIVTASASCLCVNSRSQWRALSLGKEQALLCPLLDLAFSKEERQKPGQCFVQARFAAAQQGYVQGLLTAACISSQMCEQQMALKGNSLTIPTCLPANQPTFWTVERNDACVGPAHKQASSRLTTLQLLACLSFKPNMTLP